MHILQLKRLLLAQFVAVLAMTQTELSVASSKITIFIPSSFLLSGKVKLCYTICRPTASVRLACFC